MVLNAFKRVGKAHKMFHRKENKRRSLVEELRLESPGL